MKSIDFCKEFNARTAHLETSTPTPTVITVNPDRSFSFVIKTPPTGWLLKQAAGISQGSGTTPVGKLVTSGDSVVSVKHVYEIARVKQRDEHLKGVGLQALSRSIVGTAKSMGASASPRRAFELCLRLWLISALGGAQVFGWCRDSWTS